MQPPKPRQLPPAFVRLAWSNLAAQSAEQIGLAAAPIVAVLALGVGTGGAGLLQVAQTLPFVLFAIPVGILADRMSRPHLMAGAEALRVVSLVVILGLIVAGQLTFGLLALLGFLGACGTVGYSVTAPAVVPALVAAEALPVANGRIELARTVSFAAGPALGGALVGWAGAPFAFGLAACLSVTAVLLLAGIREPPRPALARRHPWHDLKEGAAFVFGHALLRPILLTQIVFNTAFFVIQAVYVPYAANTLGLSATAIGVTLAAYGIGMVGGALAAARLMLIFPLGRVIGTGPVVGFIASLVMVATLRWPSPLLAGLSFFLLGAGPILWVISTTTLRQTVTPAGLLGRVSAINIMAYGARPLGAAIGAYVGDLYGAATCFGVAAALFALQAAIILVSPAIRLDAQPAAA